MKSAVNIVYMHFLTQGTLFFFTCVLIFFNIFLGDWAITLFLSDIFYGTKAVSILKCISYSNLATDVMFDIDPSN